MRNVLLISAIYLLAGCSSQVSPSSVDDIAGLWQFPDREVWIQIGPDGSVFQCRVAQHGVLIVSKGQYAAPNSLVWEQEWDPDLVYVVADGIRLDGKHGKFTFTRARQPMGDACAVARAAA